MWEQNCLLNRLFSLPQIKLTIIRVLLETLFSVQKCQVGSFNFSQCPWSLHTQEDSEFGDRFFVYWFVSCCWISSSNWFSFEVFYCCCSGFKFRSYHSLSIVVDYALNMFFKKILWVNNQWMPLNIHLQRRNIDPNKHTSVESMHRLSTDLKNYLRTLRLALNRTIHLSYESVFFQNLWPWSAICIFYYDPVYMYVSEEKFY